MAKDCICITGRSTTIGTPASRAIEISTAGGAIVKILSGTQQPGLNLILHRSTARIPESSSDGCSCSSRSESVAKHHCTHRIITNLAAAECTAACTSAKNPKFTVQLYESSHDLFHSPADQPYCPRTSSDISSQATVGPETTLKNTVRSYYCTSAYA